MRQPHPSPSVPEKRSAETLISADRDAVSLPRRAGALRKLPWAAQVPGLRLERAVYRDGEIGAGYMYIRRAENIE